MMTLGTIGAGLVTVALIGMFREVIAGLIVVAFCVGMWWGIGYVVLSAVGVL